MATMLMSKRGGNTRLNTPASGAAKAPPMMRPSTTHPYWERSSAVRNAREIATVTKNSESETEPML